MKESDNVNNGTDKQFPNSPSSSQSEQVSCPFYSVVPNQNMALPQLPAARSTEDDIQQAQLDVELDQVEVPQDDWVAEPDSEKQALIDAEFQKLLSLNKELQADNDDLYNQVEELKQSLTDAQKALQWQKKRSSVTESMLNQQTQEISAAQEQIKSLFQELETAVQSVQRQESIIENYQVQLETSQQRLAQLERECALIQANYNEQSHHLLQSEGTCRELRSRLMRQQRQTLQFKAALEKCLETPIPINDSQDYSRYESNDHLFTNAKPIQPWSVELDSESTVESRDYFWHKFPISSTDTQDDTTENQSSLSNQEKETLQENPQVPLEDRETANNEDSQSIPENSASALPSLDEQLDSVIEMFFASQTSSTSPQSSQQKDTDSKKPTIESVSENSNSSVAEDQQPITPTTPIVENITEQTKDYWSQIPQVSPFEFVANPISQTSFRDSSTGNNSPSPVIYPQRPPKGRKSMSAVELPNFRSSTRNDANG
ncbi:MAG: hypothetical protein QNJ47_10880 [Nostocaceae cyanobacterium]|nr:hypothetical protein [Nostocaceae cyanobacterium]